QSSATVTVSLIANTIQEQTTRHFTLKLLSATGATIRWGLGAGTLIDDDAANPPTASTGDVLGLNATGATVAATANAQGEPATAYIEYGTSAPAYGSKTAAQGLPIDSTDHTLSFGLSGLAPNTTYHYRVVATRTNNATAYGDDKTFTTPALAPPPPPPPPPPPAPPPPPPPPP